MRKIILSASLVFLIIVAVIVVLLPKIPISLGSFSEGDITGIHIVNGSNGEVTEISEEGISEIYELTGNMNRLFGGKVDTTGWDYEVIILTKDMEYSVEVISDNTVVIDGKLLSIDSDLGRRLKEAVEKYGKMPVRTEKKGEK